MLDLKFLLSAANALYKSAKDFSSARRERRLRLATYFSDLAQLLENVAASLRKKNYPHGSCAELYALAKRLPRTVKGLIEPERARKIQDDLFKIWEIEQLHSEIYLLKKKDRDKRLTPLSVAAGELRALAAELRVS